MTAEREEPQLQVRDGGGGRHWRVSDVGFFFPANIQQLKLQQGKGAFLGGGAGGESSWEKEHLRIMLIIKKKKKYYGTGVSPSE